MRRFVFKLEGVLEQRKQLEQQRQRQLAEMQKHILILEREVEMTKAAEKSAAVALRGPFDPRMLGTHVRFSQVMRQKLSKLREQLDTARNDLAAAHATLTEASKQRKVLEKLQEKQQARWMAEHQRHEAAAHDDISQQMTRDDLGSHGSFPATGP